jgi:hypothetical protein
MNSRLLDMNERCRSQTSLVSQQTVRQGQMLFTEMVRRQQLEPQPADWEFVPRL